MQNIETLLGLAEKLSTLLVRWRAMDRRFMSWRGVIRGIFYQDSQRWKVWASDLNALQVEAGSLDMKKGSSEFAEEWVVDTLSSCRQGLMQATSRLREYCEARSRTLHSGSGACSRSEARALANYRESRRLVRSSGAKVQRISSMSQDYQALIENANEVGKLLVTEVRPPILEVTRILTALRAAEERVRSSAQSPIQLVSWRTLREPGHWEWKVLELTIIETCLGAIGRGLHDFSSRRGEAPTMLTRGTLLRAAAALEAQVEQLKRMCVWEYQAVSGVRNYGFRAAARELRTYGELREETEAIWQEMGKEGEDPA